MLYYSIDTARRSALSRVVVSTDGKQIARVASALRADVIHRPAEFATDTARIELAVKHALYECEKQDGEYDAVMLLQNSSPLRTVQDLNNCIVYLDTLGYNSITSITEVHEHPYKILTWEGRLLPWMAEMDRVFYRRQDLPKMYIANGAIYVIKRDAFIKEDKMIAHNAGAYVMPRERSIDAHTVYDAIMAEALIKKGILKNG